jgi:mannosidase alpha-like ER degradation enhancer 2
MGETIFNDFMKHCRVETGYAALQNVITKEKRDEMESFALAETFKYFYLLFAAAETLDFNSVVFNTEAHPLRRVGDGLPSGR